MPEPNNAKTKRVIIIRHAKSSHENPMLTDKERPLNGVGRSDAALMARELQKIISGSIQQWEVSSAKRTVETFEYFKNQFQVSDSDYDLEDVLYLISEEDLEDFIKSMDNHLSSIAVICHNPGATDFVDRFSEEKIVNVPTCGIAIIEASCELWSDFFLSTPRVSQFIKPSDFK